uniref:Reverse transcriptase domain-containing protein n=1 Tax=Megaselia scalaris TaxID=36166 RepID=T1GG80_MEGSC
MKICYTLAELFKAAHMNFNSAFHPLLLQIWNAERMPTEWSDNIIRPFHKKGDKKDCTNYRRIGVLNIGYKIMASILCERLRAPVILIIRSYQCDET